MLSGWLGLTGDSWAVPSSIVSAELDRATGLLAEPETPSDQRYVEFFVPGTEPAALRLDARRLFRLGPIIGY